MDQLEETAPPGPTNAVRDDGTAYYRGGCVRGMPRRGACHQLCAHRAMVEDYRAARTAWEERRETGEAAPTSVPGIAGSGVAIHQLEDDDYRRAFPPPTFRAWLEGNRG